MEKVLKFLRIKQERNNPKSRDNEKQWRINPYNPLTYIFLLIYVIALFFVAGFYGVTLEEFWKDLKWR